MHIQFIVRIYLILFAFLYTKHICWKYMEFQICLCCNDETLQLSCATSVRNTAYNPIFAISPRPPHARQAVEAFAAWNDDLYIRNVTLSWASHNTKTNIKNLMFCNTV